MPKDAHPMLFLAILLIGALLLYPFLSSLLLAAITAHILRPFLRRLESHTRSYHLALIVLAIIITVPLIALAEYLIGNVSQLLGDISSLGAKAGILISTISLKIAETPIGSYFREYFFSAEDITRLLTGYTVSLASAFVRDIPALFLDVIVYVSATYYFLRDGQMLVAQAAQYAKTLPHEERRLVFSMLSGMKKSFDVLSVSYITMSVITTVLAFIGFAVLGVPHSGLLAILCGLFSFLPIFGVWMVYVPAGIYQYFAGNAISAILTIAYGVIVLTFATDFIIKPILGARKSGVSPFTILLGFFSGPLLFGAKGIVLGPVLLVIVETVLREYIQFRIGKKKN